MPTKKSASKRKYSKKATNKISDVMHEYGQGKLKSGKSGKKVTNRKQAVAIAISEARSKGYKTPSPKPGSSSGTKKKTTKAKRGTARTKK